MTRLWGHGGRSQGQLRPDNRARARRRRVGSGFGYAWGRRYRPGPRARAARRRFRDRCRGAPPHRGVGADRVPVGGAPLRVLPTRRARPGAGRIGRGVGGDVGSALRGPSRPAHDRRAAVARARRRRRARRGRVRAVLDVPHPPPLSRRCAGDGADAAEHLRGSSARAGRDGAPARHLPARASLVRASRLGAGRRRAPDHGARQRGRRRAVRVHVLGARARAGRGHGSIGPRARRE